MTIKDIKIILLSLLIFLLLWSGLVLFLNLYPFHQPSEIKNILVNDKNLIITYDYIDKDISEIDIFYQDNTLVASFEKECINRIDKKIIINLSNIIFDKNGIYELNIDFGHGWLQVCELLIENESHGKSINIVDQWVMKY